MMGLSQKHSAQGPVIEQQQHTGQGHQHGLGHQTQGHDDEYHDITYQSGFSGIAGISYHCQHPEGGGEQVFAFRNPGYGIDVDGVNRKQGRHKCRLPGCPGHEVKGQKQKEDIDDVKCKIH